MAKTRNKRQAKKRKAPKRKTQPGRESGDAAMVEALKNLFGSTGRLGDAVQDQIVEIDQQIRRFAEHVRAALDDRDKYGAALDEIAEAHIEFDDADLFYEEVGRVLQRTGK